MNQEVLIYRGFFLLLSPRLVLVNQTTEGLPKWRVNSGIGRVKTLNTILGVHWFQFEAKLTPKSRLEPPSKYSEVKLG